MRFRRLASEAIVVSFIVEQINAAPILAKVVSAEFTNP
jgi:hypothetical protein